MKARRWMLGLLISGSSAVASANEIQLSASRSASITNESNEMRLLVAFPELSELTDQWVTGATLTLPLGSAALQSDLGVAVEAVTASWDGSATWTTPWSTAGGDLDRTYGATVDLAAGTLGDVLTLEVTDIVRAIVEREIEDRGMMLLPAAEDRAGFSGAEVALLGSGLSQATLRVYYRDLKALGYEGGVKALLARRRSAVVDGDRR